MCSFLFLFAVSLSLVLSKKCVFVWGEREIGIGGVHRGDGWDVSADLEEFRSPVCVITSGVKSILDIPRTLEYLETKGVPVIGFKTKDFPNFFTQKSGCKVPIYGESVEAVGNIVASHLHLFGTGCIVSNPIPLEAEVEVEDAILQGIEEGKEVRGKDITPYLLQRVNEITGGKSLQANIALVYNNALVGTQIANAILHQKTFSGGNWGDFKLLRNVLQKLL